MGGAGLHAALVIADFAYQQRRSAIPCQMWHFASMTKFALLSVPVAGLMAVAANAQEFDSSQPIAADQPVFRSEPVVQGLPVAPVLPVVQAPPTTPAQTITPAPPVAHAPPIGPGRYCVKEQVKGISGDGEEIALGYFLMSVEIGATAGQYAVSFSNGMRGSDEILAAATDRATILPDGSLEFAFTDGLDNQGSARIYPTGLVDVVVTGESGTKQTSGNYGSFFVYKGGCAAEEFAPAG